MLANLILTGSSIIVFFLYAEGHMLEHVVDLDMYLLHIAMMTGNLRMIGRVQLKAWVGEGLSMSLVWGVEK